MKKNILLLVLFIAGITFAQNRSDGPVTTTLPSSLGETFRFDSGLVTQLDAGSGFGFTSDRWFSLGRLFTGSQNVYGLRFQLPNKALTLGYQDINDLNPRLQWIGSGSSSATDFEFRVANSFTSTSSTLVATMTNDGKTFFGPQSTTTNTRVGVDYSNLPSGRTGVTAQNSTSTSSYSTVTGFKSINNVFCQIKNGVRVESDGGAFGNTGVSVSLLDGRYNSGVSAFARSEASGGSSYGVSGSIGGPSGVTPTGFGAGIYGSSAASTNRYAGYFNGNVFVTGTFTVSDKKLKDNIKIEENILDKLTQLDAVSYTFKPNDQLNLPSELQHGFLAQNLEEVFPELVTTITKPILGENNKELGMYEYKAVNYVGMISILTSSLQELQEEVKTLKNQIEAMNVQAASDKEEAQLNTQDEVGNVEFSMEQNKPNPFTNQTVINYTLPSNTKATISVVDLSGKFIKDYNISNEKGQLTINSSEIGKGIFVYALISDNEVIITRKMIIR
ncbi:chaperone of endosialidase [Kordia sp. SMS9]|uniref:tail fiber domain-containing protein n=1 Tax=Kordia sp. SMS9 TaxID=2282170 RepID=UPI000E0D57B7|nr:tail fiber domain-containing protein [Kordia sp. SMS9]AXG69678.1 chaperone of endosialidase [Kordia sp. SMS9]